MKRFLTSFLLGAVPAVLLLVLLHSGPRPSAVSGPVKEAPRPPDPKVFEKWQAARSDSGAEALRYLESLDADGARALLGRIESMEEGDERKAARVQAFERFAEFDLSAALAYAEAAWPFPERIAIVRETVLKWAATDIDACWDWIERCQARSTAEEESSGEWHELLGLFYRQRESGTPSGKEIARTWREIERCLAALPDSGGSALIPGDGVFNDPATKAPVGSLWPLVHEARRRGDWAGTLSRLLKLPRANLPLPAPVAYDWLAHDMDGALAWAAGQEDPEFRAYALEVMTARQSILLGDSMQPHIDRADFYRKLAAVAPDIVAGEFDSWDPLEASAWLAESIGTLPNPDGARAGLANSLASHDIDAALAWAGSIESELQRKTTTNQVLLHWNRYEPWAAEAWAKEELGWTEEDFARELTLER